MTECQNLVEIFLIGVRGFLLSLVAAGGMLCIYFGWNLYGRILFGETAGEIDWSGVKIKFSASAPGVFLALFGCYLLYAVSQHRFETIEDKSEAVKVPSVNFNGVMSIDKNNRPNFDITRVTAVEPSSVVCDCLIKKSKIQRSYMSGNEDVTILTIKQDLKSIRAAISSMQYGASERSADFQRAVQALVRLEKIVQDSDDAN